MVHQFSYRRRKNVNEIKSQVIRMFVFPNNGGALSIIGVIMKAPDDSWIRSAPLVTELPQYWVFIIFIWMLDCFSNSDGDQSVLTRHDHCRLHGVFRFSLALQHAETSPNYFWVSTLFHILYERIENLWFKCSFT